MTGVHCDSGCQLLFVQLPFTFSYYGQPFTQYNVISDGNIQFNSSTDLTPIDPLPVNGIHSGIFPFWNDLCTDDDCSGGAGATLGNGVFVTTVGTAPNRLYVIEWRAHPTDIFPGPGNVPTPPNTFFELQLEETTNNIYFVYGASTSLGLDPFGTGATAGIQDNGNSGGPPFRFLQYAHHEAKLLPGTAVCFSTIPSCGLAQPASTATPTPTATLTATATNTPLPGVIPASLPGAPAAPPTATPTATATLVVPKPEKDDKPPPKTELQNVQGQHTSQIGFDDLETEGNVVAVDYSVSPPIAYIANIDTPPNATLDQLVQVILACPGGCPTVRPGDYIGVQGVKDHEFRYIAEAISIIRHAR